MLARREDGVVIGDHQRLTAARRLGLTEVPVIWLDLSVEESRLLKLALNRIGGTWDEQLLSRLLDDLGQVPELDLSLSGFAEDEIVAALKKLDAWEKREPPESFDVDEAFEEATSQPRTAPGDPWALGDHRLMCGD